ncbi:hypothetical protein E2C01_035457 [Portunus trituberculatus]|uniref:Uncharacterized protein n=1 Tax=Portunus trituberculatus TaxID=210409 RepID=A0A5B7F383_PORTR|nr:hypothetical protein [Portunus trituberculatus]
MVDSSLTSPPQPLCYVFSMNPSKVLLKIPNIACPNLPRDCPNPARTGPISPPKRIFGGTT